MNILILGSGAREQVLYEKLSITHMVHILDTDIWENNKEILY